MGLVIAFFLQNTSLDSERELKCFEVDPVYSSLTFAFVFLPHLMVLRGFVDSATAGLLCILWGLLFTVTSLSLEIIERNNNVNIMKVFLLLLGVFSFCHGVMAGFRVRHLKDISVRKLLTLFLLFPVIIFISPGLITLTKFRVIFYHNDFLDRQRLTLSLGEAVLESSPQLALQVRSLLASPH